MTKAIEDAANALAIRTALGVPTNAELAILGAMSAEGFPAEVLIEKRVAIVGAEFDSADQETIAALMAAVREQAQE